MATFYQKHEYFDSEQRVTVLFVVAETSTQLYNPPTISTEILCVSELPTTRKEVDNAEGVIRQDDLEFTVDEGFVTTSGEAAFITAIKKATNPATPVFVGIFINDPAYDNGNLNPSVLNADFVGVISQNIDSDDIAWNNSTYVAEGTPTRRYTFATQSLFDFFIARYDLADIINGNVSKGVTGISPAWITTNVQDRNGWFKGFTSGDESGHRDARWADLVNLNTLVDEVLSVVKTNLAAEGLGSWTFRTIATDMDFKTVPAHLRPVARIGTPSYTYGCRALSSMSGNNASPYTTKANDERKLTLGTYGSATYFYDPFVDWKYFQAPAGGNWGTTHKDFMATARAKTVQDFLYEVAGAFNCCVSVVLDQYGYFNVSFTPVGKVATNNVIVREADKASSQTEFIRVEKEEARDRLRYGRPSQYHVDGEDDCAHDNAEGGLGLVVSQKVKDVPSGSKVSMFCTGVPLIQFYNCEDGKTNVMWGRLPLNGVYYLNGTREPYDLTTRPDKTGMFAPSSNIWVVCRHDIGAGIGTEIFKNLVGGANEWYSPVAQILVKRGTTQKAYGSISEWQRDEDATKTSYYESSTDLECAFITAFYDTSAMTKDWKHLRLGAKVSYAGVTMRVVSIERNWHNGTTNVTIVNNALYEMAASSGSTDNSVELDDRGFPPAQAMFGGAPPYEVGDVIVKGDAVVGYWTGTKLVVYPYDGAQQDGWFIGIALNSANIGDFVQVQTEGLCYVAGLSAKTGLNAGRAVYARPRSVVGATNNNLWYLPPTTFAALTDECMIRVGVMSNSTDVLLIQPDPHTTWIPMTETA